MLRLAFAGLLAALIVIAPTPARAQPPTADLMARLGASASRFETLRKKASYDIDGRLESLDRAGHPSSTTTGRAHVESDGTKSRFEILSLIEDGADTTADAKDKQKKREAESLRNPPTHKREWRMPFHPNEQPRYYFNVEGSDPHDANRVRISFVPKIVEDDTIEGSVWVDATAGTLISAGFKLSKPPSLVDTVHVTMLFGEPTSLGPAPSRITVDAQGGLLFVRKHYHGEATLKNYRVTP